MRLLLFMALLAPAPLAAEPGDIDAAARGVVRVVIVGREGEEVFPVSHGSGFAVAPGRIVTNAHVVRDAERDPELRVAIVPPESGGAVLGRVIAINARADLALIALDGPGGLPPLALASGTQQDSGEVAAVGYPMNVDRAQGLSIDDIFTAQPPVNSRGFLSGSRPSREFDSVLHTAPIARGNSGGPLLDGCGRVVGVNSFGAESGGADAEFYFAVSARELMAFLRANGVRPRLNETPCRSLADLDAEEQARSLAQQQAARAALAQRAEARRAREDRARFEAEMRVLGERDDRLLASMVLLLVAAGLGWWAVEKRPSSPDDGAPRPWPTAHRLAAAGAGIALLGAGLLQLTRPGIEEIERMTRLSAGGGDASAPVDLDGRDRTGSFVCRLDAQRSRVTTSSTDAVSLAWSAGGCVNTRTQYGFSQGIWSRVLVPNDEQEVSVNSFDPERREFRTERYLLSRPAMERARAARAAYRAATCGGAAAAATLGEQQRAVLDALPARPNERLVYSCDPASDREGERN